MKRACSYQGRSTLWGRDPHRSITYHARLDERAPNSGKTRTNKTTYGNGKVGYEGLCERGSNRTFGGETLNPNVGPSDGSSWITPRSGMGDRETPMHRAFLPSHEVYTARKRAAVRPGSLCARRFDQTWCNYREYLPPSLDLQRRLSRANEYSQVV